MKSARKKGPAANAVVDTNVVAYYLLRTEPFSAEATAFWNTAGVVYSPASWEAEMVNVLFLATRAGVLDVQEGLLRLRLARQLNIVSVPVRDLWEGALVRASVSDHPAYDTVFVELAERLNLPLATFDNGVLRKFPDIALRPGDFAGNGKGR